MITVGTMIGYRRCENCGDDYDYAPDAPMHVCRSTGKRVAELEAALRQIAELKVAVEIMMPDIERADECEAKLGVAKSIARRAALVSCISSVTTKSNFNGVTRPVAHQ